MPSIQPKTLSSYTKTNVADIEETHPPSSSFRSENMSAKRPSLANIYATTVASNSAPPDCHPPCLVITVLISLLRHYEPANVIAPILNSNRCSFTAPFKDEEIANIWKSVELDNPKWKSYMNYKMQDPRMQSTVDYVKIGGFRPYWDDDAREELAEYGDMMVALSTCLERVLVWVERRREAVATRKERSFIRDRMLSGKNAGVMMEECDVSAWKALRRR